MSERERQKPYDITCIWALKYDTNELIYETETDSQTQSRLVVAKRKGAGEEWIEVCDQQMQSINITYRMDKQCPTV